MSLTSQSRVERTGNAGARAKGIGALVGDERGVIMVVGVFFTFMMIGCCWFLFGIGNAIAYRENLQNAADAAAFAAAVYDARGMNLIAMINIIMGIILSLLIVAKFLEIVAVMAKLTDCNNYIMTAESDFPDPYMVWKCPYDVGEVVANCPSDCSDIKKWQNDVKSFDKGVHEALQVLQDGQKALGVAWPWIAAGKSGNMQAYYKNGVPVTTSFAYSQIPALGGSPKRYGLPITLDTYANLCKVSDNDISNLGGLIPANPISQFANVALNAASQWFCDDATGSVIPTIAIINAPIVLEPQACVFCAIENNLGDLVKAFTSGSLGQADESMSPLPMSTNNPYVNQSTNTYGGVKKDQDTYSPMMLLPKATMGLDYFGVWSTALGQYDDSLNSKRTQIAVQQAQGQSGSKVVIAPPNDVAVGVAKAEFYSDPKSGDSKTNEVSVSPDESHDVMWNMRWRARLRRYHYFPSGLGEIDMFIDALNALEGGNFSSAFADLKGGSVSVDKLPTSGAPTIFH